MRQRALRAVQKPVSAPKRAFSNTKFPPRLRATNSKIPIPSRPLAFRFPLSAFLSPHPLTRANLPATFGGLRPHVPISPGVDEMDHLHRPTIPHRPPAAHVPRNRSRPFPVQQDARSAGQTRRTAHRRAQHHWLTSSQCCHLPQAFCALGRCAFCGGQNMMPQSEKTHSNCLPYQ